MCLTIGDEEEGYWGIGVVQRGILVGGACPLGWGAHNGSQYP
jgi:hypothetical protein